MLKGRVLILFGSYANTRTRAVKPTHSLFLAMYLFGIRVAISFAIGVNNPAAEIAPKDPAS
jgi:hypothetical protein